VGELDGLLEGLLFGLLDGVYVGERVGILVGLFVGLLVGEEEAALSHRLGSHIGPQISGNSLFATVRHAVSSSNLPPSLVCSHLILSPQEY